MKLSLQYIKDNMVSASPYNTFIFIFSFYLKLKLNAATVDIILVHNRILLSLTFPPRLETYSLSCS